ncbi:plasmid mobilization relaxosome protein MobC [Oceanibium sediminis]|uniref:plasmid mobilization relaxosome protein MobC n=1 Tax=Oceanibium sediminis TaxID=2026339 RepID=UPI000DD3F1CF|nr:plasmid mobilization relaxosome protein MobC [Oceanibium sediminis]
MTKLKYDFNGLADWQLPDTPEPEKPAPARLSSQKPKPFSLRLSFDERARLEQDASGMALGAYIRDRLFGDDAAPRQTRGHFPVKDYAALGRVLAALGQSRLSNNLNQLAKAVNTGSLPVTPETEADLRQACKDVQAMRSDLLIALGLHETGSGSKAGWDLKP